MVIFTDAASVLNKLQKWKLLRSTQQPRQPNAEWIAAPYRIKGNEQTARLVREGDQLDQEDRYTPYTDEKTAIKTFSKERNGNGNTQILTSQTACTN